MFVVVAVDYFTRRLWAKVLESKHGCGIFEFIKEACKEGRKPEETITDNGREFCSRQVSELCRALEIKH